MSASSSGTTREFSRAALGALARPAVGAPGADQVEVVVGADPIGDANIHAISAMSARDGSSAMRSSRGMSGTPARAAPFDRAGFSSNDMSLT